MVDHLHDIYEDTSSNYAWPEHDDLRVVRHVVSPNDPIVLVGLLPHANEPLGSSLCPLASSLASYLRLQLLLAGPIDPPPASHRFPLPCSVLTFLENGWLQLLTDQAEFAHVNEPINVAQKRAAALRSAVVASSADAVLLLHNDPFAIYPYLYAHERLPEVELALANTLPPSAALHDYVNWTNRLGPWTYAFFPARKIGVHQGEAAGIALRQAMQGKVLTLELPMFDWTAAPDARVPIADIVSGWIKHGGGATKPTVPAAAAHLRGRTVPMVSASLTARFITAVLKGLASELI
ncbi:hypothetical protein [Acidithiobacillus thiooxidans]|jgi:hypothetical protein|uniref:Uncharacterized protein n=1 Tax=Acidithiobacillus thiooxidans ATCC 19377 TaxID=637390 RepID=A0A543PZ03_ACITH|nr:hypothetical protein [Acidithiobacillus thiooxidans]TQN49270.1 hypothetical protein DLNHIDIE_03450 [Acidithiobacillus thiooxidans ATCC 19377]